MKKDKEITRLSDEILHLAALSGELSPVALGELNRSPKYIKNSTNNGKKRLLFALVWSII